METKRFSSSKFMVESAMMIAIASVLSIIKIVDMPYGGSVTLASMLPIVIIGYRHGTVRGLLAGLAYGVVQQLLGLKNLTYVSEWYSVLAVIVLDYLAAFLVLGLGGMFRGKFASQPTELALGAFLAGVLRFVCHFISGITVWAGWGMPGKAALLYSLGYNSTYMLPETIVLTLIAWYLGSQLDFTTEMPKRIQVKDNAQAAVYGSIGILVLIGGVIADIALIFGKLQNEDSGEWMLSGLNDVRWVNVIVVTAVCLIVGITLIAYSKYEAKKSANR